MLGATDVLGGVYTPHCAAIQPAKLVRGLAHVVERLGVTIHEGTSVTSLAPGEVRTDRGTVRARHVVRATEGYTASLPGHRRDVAPVYSLMLATEPLPAEFWAEVGLARRETFNDLRHLIIYGQRTADDRLAFGGRGAPYHFGSRIRPEFDRDEAVYVGALARALRPVPRAAGAPGHPHVGRSAGRGPGLVRLGGPGRADRDGVGRRVRRRRCRDEQPGRTHPGGPAARHATPT